MAGLGSGGQRSVNSHSLALCTSAFFLLLVLRATGMGDRGVVTDLTCLSLSVDPELHRGLCAPGPLTDVERAPFC